MEEHRSLFDSLPLDFQCELWKHFDQPSKNALLATCRRGRNMVEENAVSLVYEQHGPIDGQEFNFIGRMQKLTAFSLQASGGTPIESAHVVDVLTRTARLVPGHGIRRLDFISVDSSVLGAIVELYPQLNSLSFYCTDDETLDPLVRLPSLTSLSMAHVEGERAYENVGRITSLERLRIVNSEAPIESWKQWRHLTNLVSFSLVGWDCEYSILDAAELFALTRLTCIKVDTVKQPPHPAALRASVVAASIATAFDRLSAMTNLVELQLGRQFTVDAGALVALTHLPQLLHLGIGRVQGPLESASPARAGVCPLLRRLVTASDLPPSRFLDTLLPFAPLLELQGVQQDQRYQDDEEPSSIHLVCSLRSIVEVEREALERTAHLLAACPKLQIGTMWLKHGESLVSGVQPLLARFPQMSVFYTKLCDPWIRMQN